MATILSVDDSPSIRQAVKIALGTAGFEVVSACDGADGLAQAKAGAFDCIITDLNMPNMDGLSMIRALRALPSYAGVPILFLTTENADSVKRQAKAAGATGWITKPFAADQLIRIVQKVMAR
jgi:two-component system chemotaxis response regulator CheY